MPNTNNALWASNSKNKQQPQTQRLLFVFWALSKISPRRNPAKTFAGSKGDSTAQPSNHLMKINIWFSG